MVSVCQKKTLFSLGLFLTLMSLVEHGATNNVTQQVCKSSSVAARSLSFSPTTLTFISPFLPQRLMSPGWDQILTVLQCAHKTTREFPDARGFLYNEVTKRCTPVLYIVSPNHNDAEPVDAEDGTLYLASEVCTNGFQIYALGTDYEPVCLRDFSTSVNFDTASKTCVSHGGFLTSAKTVDKLELVASLANSGSRWVGLDDIDTEGVFIWHSDGSNLTSEQKDTLFPSGEPNNLGNEDCIQYRSNFKKLNDFVCSNTVGFVCEIPLPSSTC